MMQIISLFYKIVLDALFPLSLAEEELASMRPAEAIYRLPRAPGYEGLVVDLPNTHSLFAYKDEKVAKLVWNIKYKKSKHAVQIGGYALWNALTNACSGSRALLDTLSPSIGGPGGDAAGSLRPVGESADSPSLAPKRGEIPLPAHTVVIPMPITKKRRRERGYNQCELLVDEIARLDLDKRFRIEKDLLIRTHHASRQTLKGRDERIESAKGIFGVNDKVMTEYFRNTEKNIGYEDASIGQPQQELQRSISLSVIVIDDVITTGSTMYEAIETLKKAGFRDVWGLSLSH